MVWLGVRPGTAVVADLKLGGSGDGGQVAEPDCGGEELAAPRPSAGKVKLASSG